MDLSYVYLSYDDVVGLSDPVRPKSAKNRTKSAASARSKATIRAPSAQRYFIVINHSKEDQILIAYFLSQ